MPGQARLFARLLRRNPSAPFSPPDELKQARPPLPPHWPELVRLLAAQNPSPRPNSALAALAQGAGTVLTGQQVGLFGGPLYTPFKAATAIARARQATADGQPHAAVFWLASEDHDFAEINQVTFPAGRELAQTGLRNSARIRAAGRPHRLRRLHHAARRARRRASRPLRCHRCSGRCLQARPHLRPGLRRFLLHNLRRAGAAHRRRQPAATSIVLARPSSAPPSSAPTSSTRRSSSAARLSKPPAITPRSPSRRSRACCSSSTTKPAPASRSSASRPRLLEPNGLWQAGQQTFSTADLLGILDAEPERISPCGAASPGLSGFSVLDFRADRRPCRDRLLRAIHRALRAHSRPPNAAHRRASPLR